MSCKKSALLVLMILISALGAPAAFASVDISRTLHIPSLPGFELKGEIPSEIDSQTSDSPLEFSLSSAGLDQVLVGLQLPKTSEPRIKTLTTPQCRVQTTLRSSEFRLELSDKDWLKSKSWTCRLGRMLFGSCNPKGPADLFGRGRVRPIGSESQQVTESQIKEISAAQCVTQGTAEKQDYERFVECASRETGHQRECLDPFAEGTLKSDSGVWTVERQVQLAAHEERVRLPEIVVNLPGEQRLELLSIGGQAFALNSEEGRWGYSLPLFAALERLTQAPVRQELRVQYATYFGDSQENPLSYARQLPMSYSQKVVRNFPLRIILKAADILQVEVITDVTTARPQAVTLLEWCRTHTPQGDFARFVCLSSGPGLLDLLSKQVQVRIRFADQDGVERHLIWERRSPVSYCNLSSGGISCNLPDSASGRWIADPETLFPELASDPALAESTLVFHAIRSFIPRAQGAAPFTEFSTPQTLNVVITTPEQQ